VTPKRTRANSATPPGLKPALKPLIQPLVEPVLTQLGRHERLLKELAADQGRTARLLEEVTTKLDVQFKRTAAIQAQLDQVIVTLSKRST
jgi:hypothetical protein